MWKCRQTGSIPLLSESSQFMQMRFWRSLIHMTVFFLTLPTLVRIYNDVWTVSPMPMVGNYTHIYPLEKCSLPRHHLPLVTPNLFISTVTEISTILCVHSEIGCYSHIASCLPWIVHYLCCVFMPGCQQWTWTWHFRLAIFTCLHVFKVYTHLSTACKLSHFNRIKIFDHIM